MSFNQEKTLGPVVGAFAVIVKLQSSRRFVWSSSERSAARNLPPDTSIDIFREVEILFTVIAPLIAPHTFEGQGKIMKITKLYYLLSIALKNFTIYYSLHHYKQWLQS